MSFARVPHAFLYPLLDERYNPSSPFVSTSAHVQLLISLLMIPEPVVTTSSTWPQAKEIISHVECDNLVKRRRFPPDLGNEVPYHRLDMQLGRRRARGSDGRRVTSIGLAPYCICNITRFT